MIYLDVVIYLILTVTLISPAFGCGLYLLYLILVPFLKIPIGNMVLQYNVVNLMILIICVIRTRKIPSLPPFAKPFGILFLFFLCEIPLQTKIPFEVQFDAWRRDVMLFFLYPIAIYEVAKTWTSKKNIINMCLIGGSIACLYSVYLTTMVGKNPYLSFMLAINGASFNDEYALAENEGRLFGRISSVFSHPMIFGMFLTMFIIWVFNMRKEIGKCWVFFECLSILAAITCGVRSVIPSVFAAYLMYLFANRRVKVFASFVAIALLLLLAISLSPDMVSYFGSIVHSNNGAVQGSSYSQRWNQLLAAFDEIRNNPLWGNGYDWSGYYLAKNHIHPKLLGFESVILSLICNCGFVGVSIWAFCCLYYFAYMAKIYDKNEVVDLRMLFIGYLAYSMVTGDYGYMKFLFIFSALNMHKGMEDA